MSVKPFNAARAAIIYLLLVLAIVTLGLHAAIAPTHADTVPHAANAHRATLVRSAHYVWGLNAPIATFAAQVHQESMWRPDVTSRAGAQGIAQFMPATAQWMAEIYPNTLDKPQPFNPGWALRAMVQYDQWLYTRIQASSPCDKWAMTLSAYNGGLGWINRDKKLASASGADELAWFDSIERFNSGRSAANFRENRDYPRKILLRWEPLYVRSGWGRGVCSERYEL